MSKYTKDILYDLIITKGLSYEEYTMLQEPQLKSSY